jgi:hypothetical protein
MTLRAVLIKFCAQQQTVDRLPVHSLPNRHTVSHTFERSFLQAS